MNGVRRQKVAKAANQFSFSNCNYVMNAQKLKRLILGSRESASKSISISCFEVNTGAAGKFLAWLPDLHGRGDGGRSSVALGGS